MLVYGRLGAGKTSYVMKRAIAHARSQKLPLIANAPVYPGVHRLRGWQDLDALELCQDAGRSECVNGCHIIREDEYDDDRIGCHPAVIVLDELHLWYPSQTSLMPADDMQDAFELISYARKRGWSIYATTQYPTRVHTGYRQVLTELVQVYPISKGVLHAGKLIDPDTQEILLPFTGAFSPRRVRYNTRAEVRPLWRARRRPGARGERGRAGGAAAAVPSPVAQVGRPELWAPEPDAVRARASTNSVDPFGSL